MSLARVFTRALVGIEAIPVTVETHISNGLPALAIVGMPETAVRESRERVRSAILNTNLPFPARRITVNLAPADLPKVGGRYDLAIALSILAAAGHLPAEKLENFEFLGELALSGELRSVPGVLPAAIAIRHSPRALVIASADSDEAGIAIGAAVSHAPHLIAVLGMLMENQSLPGCPQPKSQARSATGDFAPLADIRGQQLAKRALEMAAAGGHNLLFKGPPGTGKTMLANALPGILPPLNEKVALELAAIRSVARLPCDWQSLEQPPMRSPHHTATGVALVGGGNRACPGEVSLAHGGVLFLDELPEFNRKVLEVLREPLEAGVITVSRASYRVRFPARFQLVAAMNPCPCGYFGDPSGRCHCSPEKLQKYLQKISGPLLDRIDLVVDVPRQQPAELTAREPVPENNPGSAACVLACRQRQMARQGKTNSVLEAAEIERYCLLDDRSRMTLVRAMDKLQLSARGYHRTLRLARTVADFQGRQQISHGDVLEALGFRGPGMTPPRISR